MAVYVNISTLVGNKDTQYAFKVSVTAQPGTTVELTLQPQLEAWDTAAEARAKTAPENQALVGTAVSNNEPWPAGVDTSAGSPGGNWWPGAQVLGEASPNKLEGNISWVALDGIVLGTPPYTRYFNVAMKVPSDVDTSKTTAWVFAVRYWYTGSPNAKLYFNERTEETPAWTEVTSAHYLYFTGAGGTISILAPMTIPAIGNTEPPAVWMRTEA